MVSGVVSSQCLRILEVESLYQPYSVVDQISYILVTQSRHFLLRGGSKPQARQSSHFAMTGLKYFASSKSQSGPETWRVRLFVSSNRAPMSSRARRNHSAFYQFRVPDTERKKSRLKDGIIEHS